MLSRNYTQWEFYLKSRACWSEAHPVNTMAVDSQNDSTFSRASASRWSMVRPYLRRTGEPLGTLFNKWNYLGWPSFNILSILRRLGPQSMTLAELWSLRKHLAGGIKFLARKHDAKAEHSYSSNSTTILIIPRLGQTGHGPFNPWLPEGWTLLKLPPCRGWWRSRPDDFRIAAFNTG